MGKVMIDQCASADRPEVGIVTLDAIPPSIRFVASQTEVARPDRFRHARSHHADHLRPLPVRLLGQELAGENGSRDEVMTVFSHELRNSLGSIRSAAWILRKESSGGPAAVKARELIERQVTQMTRLVEDLLDASRIRRGQLSLHREPVDLCVIVAEALQTVAFVMQERGHRLAASFPAGPVLVHADAARLEQVIVNLLLNAAKYTDPKGQIGLDVIREARQVIVRIRDNGIGIDSKALPLVFDLFAQANPSSRHAKGGLGIGLALVRSVVALHGGHVSASSAGLGCGSEFTIALPTLPD
jgi:signal transduction histidine kinase